MFRFLKKKKQLPYWLEAGMDIDVEKTVDIRDGASTVHYFARVFYRNQPTTSTVLMDYANVSANFPTEEKLARAISEYINDIKKDYSLQEFYYKLKVEGTKAVTTTEVSQTADYTKTIVTTIKTKLTDRECKKAAKTLEDLLK